MNVNTFYATSCSNSTYTGLLNGGEASWSRSASNDGSDINLGSFYINPELIESTIPGDATISSIVISHQFRQNRSNTSLYVSRIITAAYAGSQMKLSQQTSDIIGDSFVTNSYMLTNVSRSELAERLSIQLVSYYRALALSSTQYLKTLKAVISWTPTETTKKIFLGGEPTTRVYIGDKEVKAAFIGNDLIYKA